MQILVIQFNPIVGDLKGNTERIIQSIERGRRQGIDLVVFPEMAITGYPPEDFILLPHFMEEVAKKLDDIVHVSKGVAVLVGLPRYHPHRLDKHLYNSAALIFDGQLIDFADKILLPTYDIFDERRYFEPGNQVKIWKLHGHRIAISICEDLWQHSGCLQEASYCRDPILEIKEDRPSCLINLSASPYSFNKEMTRLNVCLRAARTLECPVILCNQVGGNDSLIFDGHSLYVNMEGVLQCAKGFVEDEMVVDLESVRVPIQIECNTTQNLYQALVLGVRDYFMKLGFKKCCFGLSGGIDSAVVACIAAEALGPQHVLALSMPSRYSSPESGRDSAQLAERLGIEYRELSIEGPFESYLDLLAPSFLEGTLSSDHSGARVTEENLQARIRGMLLMAFSNQLGYVVLSTGNKSEFALGYSTLYGDMCGGLAVIGDVTKKQVYDLADWINRHQEIIPHYTIDRPPSAELRPNQKDSDSLPDYEIIDRVVQAYVEEHRSPQWISDHFQYSLLLVEDLIRRIHLNEYKRRQAPPVLRVSDKSFAVGRRFPIVQRWI